MIQWLAATQTERSLEFFTFGDKSLRKAEKVIKKFTKKFTVAEVYKLITNYGAKGIW